jgi:hypothetical protein
MHAHRAQRFLLLPLIAVEAVGTGYLIADAAGAFPLPAGQSPASAWLEGVGFLGLLATGVTCAFLALSSSRPVLGWLLAPLCAAFLGAFFYSYDHGADGYVPRYGDEHPGLGTWAAAVGAAALLTALLTHFRPQVGLACTSAVAVAVVLPMLGIAFAGH